MEREREGGVYVTLQSQKQTDEGGEAVSSKSCDVIFFFSLSHCNSVNMSAYRPLAISPLSSANISESLSSPLLFPTMTEDVPVF